MINADFSPLVRAPDPAELADHDGSALRRDVGYVLVVPADQTVVALAPGGGFTTWWAGAAVFPTEEAALAALPPDEPDFDLIRVSVAADGSWTHPARDACCTWTCPECRGARS